MKEEAKQQGEEETKTKTISDRKRKANRQNAQCSTGPKIQRGKNRSRQNVVKHGLLVKVLPLHSYEDAEEVAAVSANLIAHLQPQGPLEQLQLDLIVQPYWKLRRLQVAENAALELGVQREGEAWQFMGKPYSVGYSECVGRVRRARASIEQHRYVEVSIAQHVAKLAEAIDSTDFVRANQRARALATEGDAGANRKDPGEYVTARADLISVLKDIQDSITRR